MLKKFSGSGNVLKTHRVRYIKQIFLFFTASLLYNLLLSLKTKSSNGSSNI